LFEAFQSIADAHHFPWDFPSSQIAAGLIANLLSSPAAFYSAVAVKDGEPVGSNFLDERNAIAGIGPISVAPAHQDRSTGRALMLDVLRRVRDKGYPGVRLVQSAYHNRSLILYTKLGFETREPLSKMTGTPPRVAVEGCRVRAAKLDDLEACNALCRRVHGHDRGGELTDTIERGVAKLVERDGRIIAYASELAFFAHAVAENNDGLKALIGGASEFGGGSFLLPTRNGELLRWCLAHGLKLDQQMTLMSIGLYNEPNGSYLPSVLY
jgi:predicted N-acetyltransferase YhbS